jgi:hypothetical protein
MTARAPARAAIPPRILRALALIALALVTLLIYRRVFAGELAGDDNSFHWAEVVRIADGLRHGDLDWWNPSANAGFPTGYYYQLLPAGAGRARPRCSATRCSGSSSRSGAARAGAGGRLPRAARARRRAVAGAGRRRGDRVDLVELEVGPRRRRRVRWSGCSPRCRRSRRSRWRSRTACVWLRRGDHLAPAIAWGAFVGMSHPVAGMALGAALAPLAVTTAMAIAPGALAGWPYPAPADPAWRPLVAGRGPRRGAAGRDRGGVAADDDRLRRVRRLPAPPARRGRAGLRRARPLAGRAAVLRRRPLERC